MPFEGLGVGITVGFALCLLTIAWKCVFRIDEGHLGLVTSFGKVIRDELGSRKVRLWRPGIHLRLPWWKVRPVSVMEQSLELAGEEGGIRAMASDGTILRLDSKLRFKPEASELYDFLFELKDPVAHIRGLFTCLLRNEIANFGADLSPSEEAASYSVIRRERRLLNSHIEKFTREKIGGRYGLRFDAVDLTDILPPDELADALNAVFSAQTEASAHHARAEGECQQRVLAASKGVEISKARASAVEIEIRTLANFLEELQDQGMLSHYIDRRRAETYAESRATYVRRTS